MNAHIMLNKKRAFRSVESIKASEFTRSCVQPYLLAKGFSDIHDERPGHEQIVTAVDPSGRKLRMRVRTCWSWSGQAEAKRRTSACQLTAGNKGGWEATFQRLDVAQQKADVTHLLIVQGDEVGIQLAALVPIRELHGIWQRQREVCAAQIEAGTMGRVRANSAENGDSPTIWLKDERASGGYAVADVLWSWQSIVDVSSMQSSKAMDFCDDTFDDLSIDYSQLGSDGSARVKTIRSEVKRDYRVRAEVLRRARDSGCERRGCGEKRMYTGFLDVHHILGVDKSDRVWNCVALCPNCHREAHFSPDHGAINDELLTFAMRYF
ncbi:HNH endonuclease [Hydrogenophaga sp.]|uniref:HNH endonuclease n=1 Tax=Hydrogenophaga sp. TaxID=1904254 RepID=UPI004035799B